MVNNIVPAQHTALFYACENDYFDIIIPYIKAGLEDNECCLWTIPDTMEVKDVQSRFSQSVENLDAFIKNEQLFISNYQNFYLQDGLFSIKEL